MPTARMSPGLVGGGVKTWPVWKSARLAQAALAAIALVFAEASAATARDWVDVELVLAVDVSRSMDMDEQALQRSGYVAAFRDPEVQRAITSGPQSRIAVTYVEWAGTGLSNVVVPWMLIDGAEAAERFADQLAVPTPSRIRRTSISGAIALGQEMIETNAFRGLRRVIDISGDGPNNEGLPVTRARDEAVALGITINGLPLILKAPSLWGIEDLDIYYEDCVIGGPGSFLITVRDPEHFAESIRRKLVLEIAGTEPRVLPAQFSQRPPPRIDCLIGEKIRRDRQRGYF